MPVPAAGLLQSAVVPPLLLPLPLLLLPLGGLLELELHPAHAAKVITTKPCPKRPIREESILLLQIVYPPMRERRLQPRRSRSRWYIFSARWATLWRGEPVTIRHVIRGAP